ncbi:glycosyltransferase family 2 protein [Bordetella trematum]|uniref:glycosyltransferase family 2 protein n=1 Tax=Bordetella trematum TaxID=123899 RepID=UPI003989A426
MNKKFKSLYHQLAALDASNKSDLIVCSELALELGLRRKAAEFMSLLHEIPIFLKTKLALLEGDIRLATKLAFSFLSEAKNRSKSTAEVRAYSRLIAIVSPEIVFQLAEIYGIKATPAYAALIAKECPSDAAFLLRNKLSRFNPEDWLIKSNILPENNKEKFFFKYLNCYGISGGTENYLDGYRFSSKIKDGFLPSQKAGGVSVIITSFNCEKYIKRSIISLINQSIVPFEIIVVDDASTDGTLKVLKEMALYWPSLRVISLNTNVGTYAAKNIGIKAAQGDYVTFQDADDWSHPRRLEICRAELEKRRYLVAVSSLYLRRTSNGLFFSPKLWPLTQWSPNTIFFDRRAIGGKRMRFDNTRTGGDSEFVARLKVVFGDRAHKKLHLPLMLAEHRSGSLTTDRLTGLNSFGFSEDRLSYQEMWSERLLDIARKDLGISNLW